jgi:hypothetical protein
MNRFIPALLLAAFCMVHTSSHAQESKDEKVLRHVVLFKFKETSSEADVKKVIDAFAALPKKIDAIKDFEWGTDNSPEGKAAGFTHCFLLTFSDEKGRDEYLPHPDHKEFGKLVGPHLDKVLVVDYWTKK